MRPATHLLARTLAVFLSLAPIAAAQHSPPPPATGPSATAPSEGRFGRLFGAPDGAPTTLPTARFDPDLFAYPQEKIPQVAWLTPTQQQLLIYGRPPQTLPDLTPTHDLNTLPAPANYGGVDLRWLAFKSADGSWVPAMLATPQNKPGPFPLVLATHGLLSHKMQVLAQCGPELTARGFAVLAIDLPLHGERPGWGADILDRKRPLQMMATWRTSVINLRQALDVAGALDIVDHERPVTLLGFSLGSWMSAITGAADPRAGAMVLMVGGATELASDLLAIPAIASTDPRNAIAAFAPRPVLMINGRNDRTVTPTMASRLFEAAREPKEQRWYDTGHRLSPEAFKDAAEWIAAHAGAGK